MFDTLSTLLDHVTVAGISRPRFTEFSQHLKASRLMHSECACSLVSFYELIEITFRYIRHSAFTQPLTARNSQPCFVYLGLTNAFKATSR